jgi:hypothetical protein
MEKKLNIFSETNLECVKKKERTDVCLFVYEVKRHFYVTVLFPAMKKGQLSLDGSSVIAH